MLIKINIYGMIQYCTVRHPTLLLLLSTDTHTTEIKNGRNSRREQVYSRKVTMTGFKLASLWSSKPDQHVKEGSDTIQLEKKKKKSFFGFVKSKKSKKNVNTVEKPSSEYVFQEKLDTSNIPSNIADDSLNNNKLKIIAFTNNPLKKTPNSPVSSSPALKSKDSTELVSNNTDKVVQSGTLPNGRLNPLSMFSKKKGISEAFSPSKAKAQTAVANKLTHQSAHSSSFQEFNQEYSNEHRWSFPEPEQKESSDDEEEDEDEDIGFMDGRFRFTQDSNDDSSKNDSLNGSSRVVSLSIRPEELAIPSVNESIPPRHELESIAIPLTKNSVADIKKSKDIIIKQKEAKKEESNEGVFAQGRFCFTEDSTDESSLNDSSTSSSRVGSMSFQSDIFRVLTAVPPSQLFDVHLINHERNTVQGTEHSVPTSSSSTENSIIDTTSIIAKDATHELSRPESTLEVGSNLNSKNSDRGPSVENAADVVESKEEKVSHSVHFVSSDTSHLNSAEVISECECSIVKLDKESHPDPVSELSRLETTLTDDNKEVLYESSDGISAMENNDTKKISTHMEQEVSTVQQMSLSDELENDLLIDCVNVVEECQKSNHIEAVYSMETSTTAAELIDNAGENVSDKKTIDNSLFLGVAATEAQVETVKEEISGPQVLDSSTHESEKPKEDNINNLAHVGGKEIGSGEEDEKSPFEFSNTDSTTSDISDNNGVLKAATNLNDIEKLRDRTHEQLNTEIVDILGNKGNKKFGNKNLKALALLKNIDTERRSSIENTQKTTATIDEPKSNAVETECNSNTEICANKNNKVSIVSNEIETDSVRMPSIDETLVVSSIQKTYSKEFVVAAAVSDIAIKRTNSSSKDPVDAKPNQCSTEIDARKSSVSVTEVDSRRTQAQLPIDETPVIDTKIKKNSAEKIKKKSSIVDTNRKVLAVVKNIEESRSGQIEQQLPVDRNSKSEQIIVQPNESTGGDVVNDHTDEHSPVALALDDNGNAIIQSSLDSEFDRIGTKSARQGLEAETVHNSANNDFEINEVLSSKQSYGSSVIPYLALREKPPPVLTRSRTSRVSKDSNETAIPSVKSNKSSDSDDVHVDIANIYGEPTVEFLSNFMNTAHLGSRTNIVERKDSIIAASAESMDGDKSPILLSLPYLSAKGLMKVDSADAPICSQVTSNSKSKSISNTRSHGKHKSVDSFFGNPFDDLALLSYTQSEEYAVNDIIDLGCELEISDCTDSASPLKDAEDQCPYEYKDIMKIDSAESIDFTMNPLRNPSNKSDSSDNQLNNDQEPAPAETGSQWNWRSVVAGTPSPSLSMMAPSLVKPDGRRRGSRSFSHASASGEDTGFVFKNATTCASSSPSMTEVQPEEISSPSLVTSKAYSKSHRRSGDMIDMDSCLAALLQNPSSMTSDSENDGYSVPSIRKVTRVVRKCQFQSHDPTEDNSVSASTQYDHGQQSLQRIRLKAAAVSDYRIKVANNARKNSTHDVVPHRSSDKVSTVQPVVESEAETVLSKVTQQQSTPQKKVSGSSMPIFSPGRDNAQRRTLSGRKLSQSKIDSPAAATKNTMAAAHIAGEPRSSTKAPAQKSKSNHAIEAVDRALRSASTTAANINRLCNVLQPQPQPQQQPQQQQHPEPLPQKDNQNQPSLNKSRGVPSNLTVVPLTKPALVEKCSSPSVNKRLDLLMGRGNKSPEKSGLKRVDSIPDAELLEKNKVTLSESLVSFDRNVVKEAQRRKLTLASKLDLQILKEVVESVNRMNFLAAKAKKSLTSMSIEEKKEFKALNQDRARLDRVYEFANSDRSSRKFSSNERIMLQPLKQELERKIKFSRLYRKHKKNEPFSFEEKAEYILLKESLEAEKRFEQLLQKFNSYADAEQRAEKLSKEVTVFERVELIILKLEQDKQQRYEYLLSKEKASLASTSQPKLSLAEKSELIIIKKEIELQYKQHQEKVALLAHQLRQGYTYSASIDPFTAAISSTRTDEETMANMVNKAFSISMDGYDVNSTKCLGANKPALSPAKQSVDVSVPAIECVQSNTYMNTEAAPASLPRQQPSFDIRKEAGNAGSGKTTVITITIKDNVIKKEISSVEDKNGSSQDTSAVTLAKADCDSHSAISHLTSSHMGKESKRDSTNKLTKIAEEKIRSYFAEKENALAREKQLKLEEFLRRSGSSESDNDSSGSSKIEEASKEKSHRVSRDISSISSSSGDAAGVSLTDTYDAYSHFNITQKAELNLLKLEGEKQRRLAEDKQRRLAEFLEVDEEAENSSVNSARSSTGSKSLPSQRNSHHRKSNTLSSAISVKSRSNSVSSSSSNLSSKVDKASASDNKAKSNVISKAANHDTPGQKTNTSPSRKRETPASSLGLEVFTKVAPKPLRPEVLKKRLSNDNVDKVDQEILTVPPSTANDASYSLSRRSDGDEDARKQRSVSTPTHFQRLPSSSPSIGSSTTSHQRLPSSSSSVGSTTTIGSKPRRQPAIVQIFEQAKELHRKAEIERIESLKNDPSRKITDPPFSLILGNSYAGPDYDYMS